MSLVQSKPADEHTLQLVYTAAGYMPEGEVVFAVPHNARGGRCLEVASPRQRRLAPFEVGEATFSSNATFTVNTDGTITAKGAWMQATGL